MRLEAANGLVLILEEDGSARVSWGETDWLGPIGLFLADSPHRSPAELKRTERLEGADDLGPYFGLCLEWSRIGRPLRTTVRAYRDRPILVFRIEAEDDLLDLATGSFEAPSVAWPWLRPHLRARNGVADGTRAFGYQYMEFALPTFSDASLARFFLVPEPPRPAIVQPLVLNAPGGRSLGLLPMDRFHEQIIAVPRGPGQEELGVRCGWHGDLEQVPSGFSTELAIWGGTGARGVLEEWGSALLRRHGTRRPSRYADGAVGRLSYWTDNGASYWYRTEPDLDVTETLRRTLGELRETGVPVHAVELDSWFYPHERSRAFNRDGDPSVPPTGMLAWEPRRDVLPEGVEGLHERLEAPPLILHSRHFSSRSRYVSDYPVWTDGDRAHPEGPELLDTLLAQAAQWGGIQYEQDWMVESFLGVRGLRARPGRARAWQEALDRSAEEHGLSLLWCMATPADFLQTVTLRNVVAIRTSGDYRYLIGSASLWAWFLYTNGLARALGLRAFKDVFLSSRDEGPDGDPHAEIEALLSALSSGPVGIGDRLGRTDRGVVLRTCRPDGLLVKPDVPIAALERCFFRHAHLHPDPPSIQGPAQR